MTSSDDDKTRIAVRGRATTNTEKNKQVKNPLSQSTENQSTENQSTEKDNQTRLQDKGNASAPNQANFDAADRTVFNPRSRPQKSTANNKPNANHGRAPSVPQATAQAESPRVDPKQNANSQTLNNPQDPRNQGQASPPRVSTEEQTDKTRIAKREVRRPAADSQLASEALNNQRTHINPGKQADTLVPQGHASQTIPPSAMNTQSPGTPQKVLNSDGVPQLLKERFEFEKVLGAGGMGVVYKAKDLLKVEAQDKDPYVAIKLLGDEFKSHPEAFIALQRESRKTQRIAHPNIVNVHDFDRDGDTVFMTMEYLEGQPLDKLISRYKTTGLPEDDAWTILQGISAALKHAHAENIIHSDFKPGNIFVTSKGLTKVFDFGIARAVAKAEKFEESVDDKTVFDAGNLGALTPAYASLEMLEGETPDVRDDIYALGCIAYELFTGKHPFNRVHANEAARLKLKAKRIPNIPKRQWKVIEKAIEFKREDRIPTVHDFWDRLTRKKSRTVLISMFVFLVVSGLVGALIYQNSIVPETVTINEDDVRSEIERQFLIDQNTKDLKNLLERADFTPSWEDRLWLTFENLRKLLSEDDTWIIEQKAIVFNLYVENIQASIESEKFERAKELVTNAERYSSGNDKILADLSLKIGAQEEALAAKLAQLKKQKASQSAKKQAVAQKQEDLAQRNEAFDVALETVNNQLKCRTTITMRDIDIAVGKLRSLNPGRYVKTEPALVQQLSSCISKIGRTFPERALEFKNRAIRTFPKNTVIASIQINPKDPCDLSLAGLGARGDRALCRDPLKYNGEDLGKGPAMVVIPAKGSVKAFALGKYEITNEELNTFCTTDHSCSSRSSSLNRLPAISVDTKTVEGYLAWLSEKTKRRYRLPKRSEWMYAARANSSKVDSNRNCLLDSRGIKKGGSLIKASIGQQNPWGVVNYLGNARELVRDGRGFAAVGGSFETRMEDCLLSKTESHTGTGDKYTGFRVLREIDVSK